MHFLMSPEDLIPVLALALLSGLRGAALWTSRAVCVAGGLAVRGLVGLAASTSNRHPLVSAVWFLLLGGCSRQTRNCSLRVTTGLAGLLGLYHGYLNGAGMGLSFTSAAVALLGLLFSVFVLSLWRRRSLSGYSLIGLGSRFGSPVAGSLLAACL